MDRAHHDIFIHGAAGNDKPVLIPEFNARVDEGIGTTTLEIDGVDELKPTDDETIPDRIEAATYMIAAAATKGDVTVRKVNPYHLTAVIQALEDSGAELDINGDIIRITMDQDPKPVDITTAPYPGYPTDAQAQWAAYMLNCSGAARIRDHIYPTRFGYVSELARLGANIDMDEGSCMVIGGAKLTGATVMSSDLRASASLVIAGLMAEGRSEILRVYHIDRGYESIEQRLTALGASIVREHTEEF